MKEVHIHIATLVVLLFGATLVIWELRQAKSLVQAQVASETYTYLSQQQLSFMGERPLASFAKACKGEPLDEEDALILMYYFTELATRAEKLLVTSSLMEGDAPWDTVARLNFRLIFSVPIGESWWLYWRKDYPEAMHSIANEMLARERETCADMIAHLLVTSDTDGGHDEAATEQ